MSALEKDAWRITPAGWLEIDSQESPPKHNLLLRDVPGTSYQVKVRLRFPATAAGFAGIVLTGDDPETWLDRSINAAREAVFPLNGLDPAP